MEMKRNGGSLCGSWGKKKRKKWGEEMGVGRVWCLGGEKKSVGV